MAGDADNLLPDVMARGADGVSRPGQKPHADGLGPLLDVLCPMHLQIDPAGIVVHAGPTIARLRPGDALPGRPFLDLFEVARPRGIDTIQALVMAQGSTLRLAFRDAPRTSFKGCLVPLADGAVINLSFGISVLEALQDYALCGRDFAPTDMTVEMLYLAEAKSAAIEESRKLNLRLRGAMIAVEEQALTDTLTGLANRRALDQRLSRLDRAPGGFALMHLDLDWFKAVNDTLGHAAGDQVLRHVAQVLGEEVRLGDTVARLGGDEFVLLFPGFQDPAQLSGIASRIIQRLSQPIPYGGQACRISCSIGTVLSGDYADPDIAVMMADADEALYQAKREGRGCHRFFRR
ncbi:MAG: diguanylate cyclase [Rhodobacterales bacterium]|nr:diguanylate cyclase [Rhodobacterales bacterium]MDX5412952.1 diguanylate cyclase [Rhodobacterales bacterium]